MHSLVWRQLLRLGSFLSETTADSIIYGNRLSIKHIGMIDPFAERAGTVPIENTEHTVPIQVKVPLDMEL